MCENLVLFGLSCEKDIYSFNTSPQVEKEKKKGMMDINLRYVAAVTSSRNLSMHFDIPRPLAEQEDCIGHVQKRLGTALRSHKNKRRGAIFSDRNGTGCKNV